MPVVTVVIVEPEVFMNLSENISIGGIVVVTGGPVVVVTGGRIVVVTDGRIVVVTDGRVVVTDGRVVVTGGPVVVVTDGRIVVVTDGRIVVVTDGRVVVTGGPVVTDGPVVTGGPVVVEGAFFGSTLNEILYEPVQRDEGLQQTPTLRRNSPGFALPESKGSLPIASSLVVSKFPLGS